VSQRTVERERGSGIGQGLVRIRRMEVDAEVLAEREQRHAARAWQGCLDEVPLRALDRADRSERDGHVDLLPPRPGFEEWTVELRVVGDELRHTA
jgi:hypothetical protein